MNHAGHGGKHSWLMMACCVPMLVIVVVLAATGVVGWPFLLYALGCTAMMFFMMRGMHGEDSPPSPQDASPKDTDAEARSHHHPTD